MHIQKRLKSHLHELLQGKYVINNQMSETFDVHRTVPFIIVHTQASTLLND